MRQFFENGKGQYSMMRFLSFGCYLTGSIVAIVGAFKGDAQTVISGTVLASAGIAGKYGQKKVEGNDG